MKKNKTNLIAIVFIGFIILVIIAVSVVIYSTPTEVVSGTAGNYTANLANGGHILEDEGFLLYSYPDKKGIYRTETDNPKESVKISDKGDGNLQVLGSGYYFTEDNTLYRCDIDGEREQVVREYAEKPLIVGSLVFYIDENGNLMKHSMQNKTESVVISGKEVKDFVVYYKKIYFIDSKGDIRKISFNGENDEVFITANAQKLSIDGQYIFYIENGKLTSAMLKGNEILKAEITDVTEYAIFGSYTVFTDGKKTYYADVNKILSEDGYEPTVIAETPASGISIDENNFYFYTDEGLKRISHEGKDITDIK